MKGISLNKFEMGNRILIGGTAAIAALAVLLAASYIALQFLQYNKFLQETANKAFMQFHTAAQRVVKSQAIDSIKHKADVIVNNGPIETVEVYGVNKTKPLWAYGNFTGISNTQVFEFTITESQPVDALSTFKPDGTEPAWEEKKIGTLRMTIVTDAFQRHAIFEGLLFLSVLITVSGACAGIAVQISRRSLMAPVNDVLIGLDQLGSGDFTTSIRQTDCGEIGKIQKVLERVRGQLLELMERHFEADKREQAHLQRQIEDEQNINRVLNAINHFVGMMANQTIPFFLPLKKLFGDLSCMLDKADSRASSLLVNIEEAVEDLSQRIQELVSAANSSIATMQIKCGKIDVADLLNALMQHYKFPAMRNRINLTYTLIPREAERNGTIYSDRSKIKIILFTLLDYIISRSSNGSVMLESAIDDEVWRLKFMTTNNKIEEKDFDIITSTNAPLGMAALRLSAAVFLVERMGGSIKVANSRGFATIIQLMLPSKQKISIGPTEPLDRVVLPFYRRSPKAE